MRILIAEDELTSALLLESAVRDLGVCERAVDGEKCFELFCAGLESGKPFDLIFLDLKMPDFDGQEALPAIREVEACYGVAPELGVKIVVTSALDDGQNLYHAHVSGCNEYLVKPIKRTDLRRALRKLGYDIPSNLFE